MRLMTVIVSVPIGLVTVLHWHWLKDRIIDHFATEIIRALWRRLVSLRHASEPVLNPFFADPSAVLNGALILGGLASLMCTAIVPARARGVLAVGGVTAIAVGLSREAARKDSPTQPFLEA